MGPPPLDSVLWSGLYIGVMLLRLRTSSVLRCLGWGLVLMLPLSLNAAATQMCDMPAESADTSHHMTVHGDVDHSHAVSDCGDPVCQATCASVAAMATTQATPAPVILPADTEHAPDTTLRAGHPQLPLRPPLFS